MGIGVGFRWVGNICGGYNYKCDFVFVFRLKRFGKNGLYKVLFFYLVKIEKK